MKEHKVHPEYTIREAHVEDILEARRMQAVSWLATYPNEEHGVSREWVQARTSSWLTPDKLEESKTYFAGVLADNAQFYRLAECGGNLVGFVHCGDKEEYVELEAIYTDPSTFGTGLGAVLMDAALEHIGSKPAELAVAVYNNRAIRFYEKFGFKKIAGSEFLFADKIPTIRMRREAIV